ncbi:MAG: OmpA family protein [Acidobacteriia bacterium]|nr:OmpA family protein [Terriglobia bacterium]
MSFAKSALRCGTMLLLAFVSVLAVSGCATKKYVKQQVDPLTGKVAEIESITKKNTEDIRDVDSRAQAGIQAATAKAEAADAKAATANQKADGAQSATDQIAKNVKDVESKLGNLDTYKLAESTEVTFKSGQFELSEEARESLDSIASKVKDQKGYILEIKGFTDDRGSESSNLQLSEKRAETVKRYLATQHNIPLFRISVIGIGEAKPAEDNKTREGRARNRRVEVRLLRSTV